MVDWLIVPIANDWKYAFYLHTTNSMDIISLNKWPHERGLNVLVVVRSNRVVIQIELLLTDDFYR